MFATTGGSVEGGLIGSVAAYALPLNGNVSAPPSGSFTGSQLLSPTGIALDSKANIYVASSAGNTITVYPPGSRGITTPSRIISGAATTLSQPNLITMDSNGNVYVANTAGGTCYGAVTVFAADAQNNAAPSANIMCDPTTHNDNTMLNTPRGVAVDGSGNIYVTNSNGPYITSYPPGSNGNVMPSGMIACIAPPQGGTCTNDLTQLGQPYGIALDSSGNIYVTNDGGPPGVPGYSVTIYGAGSSGNAAPLETIAGNNTQLNVPEGIVLDSKGNIYVANLEGNVTVYPSFGSTFVGPVNQAPIASISTAPFGFAGPSGLAIGQFTP